MFCRRRFGGDENCGGGRSVGLERSKAPADIILLRIVIEKK